MNSNPQGHASGEALRVVQFPQFKPCKTINCPGESEGARGKHGGLCQRCRDLRRAADAARVARNAGKHEEKVRALLPLAKTLDKALDRYAPVREELKVAMSAWAAALEELTS